MSLGTFVSGSNTTSNVLFVTIQFNVAQILNIPPHILVSLQNTSGGIGDTFCIKGVVIAASVAELHKGEGRLMKLCLAVSVVSIAILLLTAAYLLWIY